MTGRAHWYGWPFLTALSFGIVRDIDRLVYHCNTTLRPLVGELYGLTKK
ncbi:MAG: hypothetical protein II886_12555 [Prevotella sp.]|nr:hypothetical protein [Prevotella sp.]